MIKKFIDNPTLTLLLALQLAFQLTLPSLGQAPAMPGGPAGLAGAGQVSGPVDIQANEQEFSGDQIIARGNVRVKYKDTTIVAPEAIMSRNEGGSPQTAVFTGHPKLIQSDSTIDSETLTFDIANHKIVADGKSHSEVISSGGDSSQPAAPGKDKNGKPIAAKPPAPVEKIITDADHQEYDQDSNKFEANGHVRVIHGDINVTSDKLQLVYGPDKKPETAIFNGNVLALQGKNNTKADHMTYSLTTRRLQANGHVKSKVIQEQNATPAKPTPVATAPSGSPDAAYAATTTSTQASSSAKGEDIIIFSDSQDFTKENGRMTAQGNVKVYYQDSVGAGPETILVRGEDGKPQKLIFIGRSQVMQPGKKWMADNITLLVPSKKVLAFGNTKSFIVQTPNQQNGSNSRVASKNNSFASREDRTF